MGTVREYVQLIQAAIAGELQLAHFCQTFMDKFTSDQSCLPESAFEILNDVYLDCDEFEPDEAVYEKRKATMPDFVIDANEFNKRLLSNYEQLVAQ